VHSLRCKLLLPPNSKTLHLGLKISLPLQNSFKAWLFSFDRVFVSCEQVKALVSVGCCYNLLSEDCCGDTNSCPGFPMSKAAKLSDLMLGKSIRDLACQV
jgi:hypothetical protein